jgi:hypothetical protein
MTSQQQLGPLEPSLVHAKAHELEFGDRLSDFSIIEKPLVKVSKVIFISSGSPENPVFLLKLHFESNAA